MLSAVDSLMAKHVDWNATLRTVDSLDDILDRIHVGHGAHITSAQGKVLELTKREQLLADGLIESFTEKWKNKCRDCRSIKQALKSTASDRTRLREKCNDLEDHVTRLQKQFGQAIDLSVGEIQALSKCNNTFKEKIQRLEETYSRADENVTRSIVDNITYLEKLKGRITTRDGVDFNVIAEELGREIANLQRILVLNKQYSVSKGGSVSHMRNATADQPDASSQILANELKEARVTIERQRVYIKELESNIEESSEFAIEGLLEDQREDGDLFYHLKQSILTQMPSEDEFDITNVTDGIGREIAAAKKLSDSLKQNLRNFRTTMSSANDENCEMRETIEEMAIKLKSASVTITSLSEENDFMKTKSEQTDQRLDLTQGELQTSQSRVRSLEHELDALKDDLRQLRDGKDDYKSHCTSLSSQQELLMEEMNGLKQEREKAWKAKAEESQRREELRRENEQFKEELIALRSAGKKHTQESEHHKREMERLFNDNDELKVMCRESDEERRKQKERLREINISTKDLEDQVYQLSSDNKKMEGEMQRLKKSKESVERRLDSACSDNNDVRALNEKMEEQLRSHRRDASHELEQSQQVHTQLNKRDEDCKRRDTELANLQSVVEKHANELRRILVGEERDANCQQFNTVDAKTESLQNELKELAEAAGDLKRNSCDMEKLMSQLTQLVACPAESDLTTSLDILRSVTAVVDKKEAVEEQLSRLNIQLQNEAIARQEDCCALEQRLKEKSKDLTKKKEVECAIRNKLTFLRKNMRRNGNRFRRATHALSSENEQLKTELNDLRTTSDDEVKSDLMAMNKLLQEFEVDVLKSCAVQPSTSDSVDGPSGTNPPTASSNVKTLIEGALTELKVVKGKAKEAMVSLEMKLTTKDQSFDTVKKERDQHKYRVEDIKLVMLANEEKFKKLERRIDTVTKFASNVNKKLEIIRNCVICAVNCTMGSRRESEADGSVASETPPEVNGEEDMLSVVRETYRANRQSFQAAVTVLESIKATYDIEDTALDDEQLDDGPGQQSAVASVLRDMNLSINQLLKDTRTFLSAPSLNRSPDQHRKWSSCNESTQSIQSSLSSTQSTTADNSQYVIRIGELEDEVRQKSIETAQLQMAKDILEKDLAKKKAFIDKLLSEKDNQTFAVVQLEKNLELLKIECKHMSNSLTEKEATLADMRDCILSEIVEQRRAKQDNRLSCTDLPDINMERIKTSLDEIKSVNDGYSEKIEDLHEKVERFLQVFLDTKKKQNRDASPGNKDTSQVTPENGVKTIEDSAFESESIGENDTQLRLLLDSKEKENSYLQIVVKEMKSEIRSLQQNRTAEGKNELVTVFNPGTLLGKQRPDIVCLDTYDPVPYSHHGHGSIGSTYSYHQQARMPDYEGSEIGSVSVVDYGPSNGYYPSEPGYPIEDIPDDGSCAVCSMSESTALPYSDEECPYCESCDGSTSLVYYSEDEWNDSQMSPADCSSVASREAKRVSLIGDLSPRDDRSTTTSSVRRSYNQTDSRHLDTKIQTQSSDNQIDQQVSSDDKDINRNEFPYNFGDRSNPTSPRDVFVAHDCKKKKNRRSSRRISLPFPFLSKKNKAKI